MLSNCGQRTELGTAELSVVWAQGKGVSSWNQDPRHHLHLPCAQGPWAGVSWGLSPGPSKFCLVGPEQV